MLGAIIGDIVGSRFEWDNIKTKEFDFLTYKCFATDDSIMSLAIAQAILDCSNNFGELGKAAVKRMQEIGRPYPNCGFGGMFYQWIYSDDPQPYGSFGNGAAMRVSACGFAANSLDEAITLSKAVTEVTHNHPEGIKGAEATVVAIYLARQGKSILEIRDYIDKHYYPMNFTLDSIRETYAFNETCQDTVPQAIMAFLESTDFEDAIRNAISIGGDSDTLAAITGGIAEAYYGVPTEIRKHALTFLDERLLRIIVDFENVYAPLMEKTTRGVRTTTATQREKNKVTTGGREKMIESAIDAADYDLAKTSVDSVETTSQKLFLHLFEACNILRGPINQDEYKTYVIPILFFKRISDTYDEETFLAQEQYGEDVSDFDEDEIHKFIIPAGCHWDDVHEQSENVGVAIVNAMMGIERANPDTLAGLFSSFDDANWTDKTKLSDDRLKRLVEHMHSLKVGNLNYSADVMGDAYEYLIKKFADLSKKNAGEFYTPRPVVRLLVNILDPKSGETVYDPACGTGGMLIEAIRHMDDARAAYGRIYGQEKNLATSAIARMNLFLHGAQDFKITQGDTLNAPNYLERGELKTFDCVIANPPFSLDNWGESAFLTDVYGRNMWGAPPSNNGDFAWIQHMVKSTDKKKGRCAVVLPLGVLFRGSREYSIRKQMIEADIIDTVIVLHDNLFYGAELATCIIYFNMNKPQERKNKIFILDASSIFTRVRAQFYLSDENVQEIFAIYTRRENIEGVSQIVTLDDIRDKDYSLSPKKYLQGEFEKHLPFSVARAEYCAAIENLQEKENAVRLILEKEGYLNG